MKKKNKLSSNIEKEWSDFVSTNDIIRKNLDIKKKTIREEPRKLSQPKILATPKVAELKTETKQNLTSERNIKKREDSFYKIIEKNKLRKIKQGKLNPETTLDLHGFTLINAQIELRRFIDLCIQQKKRFLLVITGKGLHSVSYDGAVKKTIKNEISKWLMTDYYKDKIQYISVASQKHGGNGAYYFFLKKL